MTRKDYVLLAAAIAKAPAFAASLRTAKASYAALIADALASDNPRFDRARFLKACNLAEGA